MNLCLVIKMFLNAYDKVDQRRKKWTPDWFAY